MNALVTQYFCADHSRLDFLYQMYKYHQGSDDEKACSLFAKFKIGLENHIAWEESLLFPAFEKAMQLASGGPTFVMRYEHERILMILDCLEEQLKGEQDCQALHEELEELLRQHNAKEEQILYPQCSQILNSDQVTEIFLNI